MEAPILESALDELRRHQDKRLSLADAVSFAVIRALALDGAFTFDWDFRDCGFDVYPRDQRS